MSKNNIQWVNNPPNLEFIKDKEEKYYSEYVIGFKGSNR